MSDRTDVMNDDDFSEELDDLSMKAFGHTNWVFHEDTDLNKYVVVFYIDNKISEEDTLLTRGA